MQEIIYHKHTGTDSPRISGRDLDGFMVMESVPTHNAPQGTLLIGKDSGTYKLYCMIAGTWTAL